MSRLSPPSFPENPKEKIELKQLMLIWGVCCCSPIFYLCISWALKSTGLSGFYPLSNEVWLGLIIGTTLLAISLQVGHVLLKLRFRREMSLVTDNPPAFMKLLSRRTIYLIVMSEVPVFCGFCLYLIQGDLTPVFGFGLVSMLLYAQSHPQSGRRTL